MNLAAWSRRTSRAILRSDMSEGGKEIVERGLRTVVAGVPVVGGFLAQAWSEYESHVQSERLDEFFEEFAKQCKQLEARILKSRNTPKLVVNSPPSSSRVIYKVERETSKEKRRMYAEALAKSVAAGGQISFDEKLTSLDTLDALTETDIQVLGRIALGGRVVWLQAWHRTPVRHGKQLPEPLAKLIVSISKLESRGLISETSAVKQNFPGGGRPQ